MKRCLTIQDYSCMGRCSLTVALPILSATGIETVGLPTAVLSNHTAFKEWTYHDLSSELIKSVDMWSNYNNHFDCIYTGYLGNGQADIVIKIIEKLKAGNPLVVIDPAFGDNGKLYAGFGLDHVKEMAELLKYADVTIPNVTEATSMLGLEYKGECLSKKEIKAIVVSLSNLGPKKVILTGIRNKEGKVGCAIYDSVVDKIETYFTECLPGKFHGAGDTFSSALVGAILNNVPLKSSVKIAHDFVHKGMNDAIENHQDGLLYGLPFEMHLNYLYKAIQAKKIK